MFWNLIKCSRKDPTSIQREHVSNGEWYNYFQTLLNREHVQHDDEWTSPCREIESDRLNSDITEREITQALSNLRIRKSPGPNGISSDLLKYTSTVITPYLVKLFNEVLTTGVVPDSWGESIIVPNHEKGSRSDPNNYRGISLINSISKAFMHVLNSRLYLLCEENSVMDESQAGFRHNYSTIDHIFTLVSVVQKYLSKTRGRLYCVFIDFFKAFDSVQHQILWNSLQNNSINGRLLTVLQSLYSKLKSCIRFDQELSDYFPCTVGTRQGCGASALLFCLVINDLVNHLKTLLTKVFSYQKKHVTYTHLCMQTIYLA